MAFTEVNQIKGDNQKYRLSPEIKKYSLLDVGFMETKTGKFELERSLDPNSPYNQGFKFKMTVEADLKKFKMATLTANGMREVDVHKGKDVDTHLEQLNFILDNLIERQIIEKA